jgi:serine/threonine protein kinase
MSPEVVKGKEADRSSDVWAFGCILYEMLTGSTTFEGDSVGEILAAVFQAEPTWGRLPSNAPEGVRRPFRGVGAELRISTNGGTQPRWRRDGRELFYIAGDDRLNAVSIRFASEGTAVEADAPVPLFARQLARALGNFRQQYMPSSDGQRFLINAVTQEATSSPITIIINWKPQS